MTRSMPWTCRRVGLYVVLAEIVSACGCCTTASADAFQPKPLARTSSRKFPARST